MTNRERVQVFITASGVPRILSGWLVEATDAVYSVTFDEEIDEVEGQVVLNFPDSERERVMTRLKGSEQTIYRFEESHRLAPDKRNYPRLYAGLQVVYRSKDAGDVWFETDEYMNFSVSGLAFDGTGAVQNGELIDLRISIADVSGSWDAVGRVIRCDDLPESEAQHLVSGATVLYSLAVAFLDVPIDCREALESLTLRLLDV